MTRRLLEVVGTDLVGDRAHPLAELLGEVDLALALSGLPTPRIFAWRFAQDLSRDRTCNFAPRDGAGQNTPPRLATRVCKRLARVWPDDSDNCPNTGQHVSTLNTFARVLTKLSPSVETCIDVPAGMSIGLPWRI